MDVVTVAVIIVASGAGGGAYWLAARASAGAWLSFSIGLFVGLLLYTLGPAMLQP